eukprot:1160936-Pelagomonas_calceolata.AAC.26
MDISIGATSLKQVDMWYAIAKVRHHSGPSIKTQEVLFLAKGDPAMSTTSMHLAKRRKAPRFVQHK